MESKVITRIWHGMTRTEHADEYLEFLIETGVADYKKRKEILVSKSCAVLNVTSAISGR